MRIMVTGGSGFIGSHFLDLLMQQEYVEFACNVDVVEPANNRALFIKQDVTDAVALAALIRRHRIDRIVHLAAQTNVDASFDNVAVFLRDNVQGTCAVLCAARQCDVARVLIMSTDEVYGEASAGSTVPMTETSPLRPSNPYAASKAAAEMFVHAYHCSFRLPVVTVRCNNVYGPRQTTDKLIPRCIERLRAGRPVPVHGAGTARRAFVYVTDACAAVLTVLLHGECGRVYNVHSPDEFTVLEVVDMVAAAMGLPKVIEHVADRPFNDARYLIASDAIRALGWRPLVSFPDGLARITLSPG